MSALRHTPRGSSLFTGCDRNVIFELSALSRQASRGPGRSCRSTRAWGGFTITNLGDWRHRLHAESSTALSALPALTGSFEPVGQKTQLGRAYAPASRPTLHRVNRRRRAARFLRCLADAFEQPVGWRYKQLRRS